MHKMEGNVIVMLDVQKDGSIVERIPGVGQDSTTANTLLGAMYPNAKIAIVSVPTEVLEDHEESAVARTLTSVRHNGRALQDGGSLWFRQEWQVLLLRRRS